MGPALPRHDPIIYLRNLRGRGFRARAYDPIGLGSLSEKKIDFFLILTKNYRMSYPTSKKNLCIFEGCLSTKCISSALHFKVQNPLYMVISP